uniref:Uncharacterized protein n=1 Tax=Candidatus Kentrum sp. UNK TaxID=2126344 RepID=A0A451AG15_9GAMM|nr:MAG: hypothetical protein BECKUNK1418G_GA0071005_105431 [Candidatus Kentron sp. UNK]VFK71361.1 MAG: hypothetical protein BECKUNK1418H_GA0071006_106129 [Candidatus Kentron sp. UNK]
MKILKSSLVAAFLALGMWASQASAGECGGQCNPDYQPWMPCSMAYACLGETCSCLNWQEECCGQ